jgi:hypothetical protein
MFIILDFLLRVLIFDLWIYFRLSDALFWILQSVGLTGLMLFLAFWNYNRLLNKHRVKHLMVEAGPWALILVLFVVVSGTVVSYSATEDWDQQSFRFFFTVAACAFYGTYIAVLYLLSASGRLWLPDPEDRHVVEHAEDLHPIDLNDLRIARMETDTFSITHRVESYTLESALFGALAFSGFLTLLGSDEPVLPKIRTLGSDLEAIWTVMRKAPSTVREQVVERLTAQDVIAALTVETVLSSMLFLLVILSRLRFYNTLKRVDHSVRSARAMNDKEDQVHLLDIETRGEIPELSTRRAYLTRRVNQYMNDAETLFDNMKPLVAYMWVFRTLGIGMFLLILVTSAFLISPMLSLAFVVLTISAYTFMHLDKRVHERRLRRISLGRRNMGRAGTLGVLLRQRGLKGSQVE